MIGTNISHFKIIRRIGQGGMGIVYLAEDERLNRPVAIKLLPSDVLHDESYLERFKTEIRATSILSHPVICQVLDVGNLEDKPYMVMEYLEGASIRQLLRERSFIATEVLQLAIEIADALDFAHEHQIIHRDIKPGNIFLSDRNHPKLLDFGLAKVSTEIFDASNEVDADTRTKTVVGDDVTGTGVTMGTVLYMSPEQARGETLDARTDLFSLGAVMYEMATGVKPFPGETSALVFDSILNKKPIPPSQIGGPGVELLDKVILKLLEKKTNHRFQSAKALRAELLRIARDQGLQVSSSRYPISAAPPRRFGLIRSAVLVLGLFLAVSLIRRQFFADATLFNPPTDGIQHSELVNTETRLHVIIPLTTEAGREDTPSVSPDGGRVAYSASGSEGKNTDIYVKLTDGGNALRLTTHAAAELHPSWSPDGQKIAFVRRDNQQSQIVVIPSLGGTPERVIADNLSNSGITPELSWLSDNQHVVFERWVSEFDSEIAAINIISNDITTLIPVPENGGRLYSPSVSPDGNQMAYIQDEGVGNGHINIYSFLDDTSNRVTDEGGHIRGITWSPDNQRVIYSFSTGGTNLLYALDVKGGTPVGVPGVGPGATFPSMATQDSVLAYVTNQSSQDVWRFAVTPSTDGLETPGTNFLHSSRNDYDLLFNADESKLSFISERSGTSEIWTTDINNPPPVKVTSIENGYVLNPVWSPNGEHFLFTSTFKGGVDVYSTPVTGGAIRDISGPNVSNSLIGTWSSDGKFAYYMALGSIWKCNVETDQRTEVVKDGWQAVEVTEENSLYYSRLTAPGNWKIYKRDLDETDPTVAGELISPNINLAMPVNWFLRSGGIFFLGANISQSVQVSKTLYFYDPATDKLMDVGVVNHLPDFYHVLEMSDDGKFLYAPQLFEENRDIIVIDQVQGL